MEPIIVLYLIEEACPKGVAGKLEIHTADPRLKGGIVVPCLIVRDPLCCSKEIQGISPSQRVVVTSLIVRNPLCYSKELTLPP